MKLCIFSLPPTVLQTHPGTSVISIDIYDDMASLKPLWEQVDGFRKAIGPIMEKAKNGIHLICYSQGLHHPYPERLTRIPFIPLNSCVLRASRAQQWQLMTY